MTEKISLMASPLPWFRMFAAHYLADRNFRTMNLEERGLILSMLLECWASIDVPKNANELSQILGVPLDQVKRALTSKALSFFEERGDAYFSKFLDDQRTQFLAERKAKKEGGQKGAAIKKLKASAVIGEPLGQPEASLHQLPSIQVTSFSVNQESDLATHRQSELKDWIQDYDSTTSPFERGVQK